MFEKWFGVATVRAVEMIREFGGVKEAGRFVARRADVLIRLRSMLPEYEAEDLRKENLRRDIDAAQRLARARTVRVATSPGHSQLLRDLPAAITLGPGELRIRFYGHEDLLAQLLVLGETAAFDSAEFEKRCEDPAAVNTESQKARKPESTPVPGRIAEIELCTFDLPQPDSLARAAAK